MLVKEEFKDLAVLSQFNKLRVYFYQPNLPEYPDVKFPGRRGSSMLVLSATIELDFMED
jgi:hypothetical protein